MSAVALPNINTPEAIARASANKMLIYVDRPEYPEIARFVISDKPHCFFINRECTGGNVVKVLWPGRQEEEHQNAIT